MPKKPTATPNLKLRGRIYWARLGIPRQLRARVGRMELMQSLGTDSPSEAKRLLGPVLAGWQAWIAAVARGDLTVSPAVFVKRAQVAAGMIQTGVLPELGLTPEGIFRRAQVTAQELSAGAIRPVDAWEQTSNDVERWAEANPEPTEGDLRLLQRAHAVALGNADALLADQLDVFLAERKEDLTNASWLELEKNCKRFVKWCGVGTPVSAVTRSMAGRFVSEVIAPRPVSAVTRNKEIGSCRVFCSWLLVRGHFGDAAANPFALQGTTIRASKRGREAVRRHWRPDELVQLLTGLESDANANLWRLTVLALWTGMRVGEVCELRVADFDATDGVLHVRQGKSASAVRAVPVAGVIRPVVEQLVQETTDGYLLPGLLPGGADGKRSHNIAKTWGRRIRTLGLVDDQLDLHGLRGTWIAACMNGGASKEVAAQLAGHAPASVTMVNYVRKLSLALCREAVAGVQYGTEVDQCVARHVAQVASGSARETVQA